MEAEEGEQDDDVEVDQTGLAKGKLPTNFMNKLFLERYKAEDL